MTNNNFKTLVVDDDPFVREMLSDILESNNYSVSVAENGKEALDKYSTDKSIKLIISDINMPEMNGLELIKELRSKKEDVPLIILTASGDISTAINALKNGANDYLIKDENIQDTIPISVKNVLEKQEMKEENRRLVENLATKNAEMAETNLKLEDSQKNLKKSYSFIRQTFGRYLSDNIVNNFLENPTGLHLGGEEKKVTIMMADLRGFTAIAEILEAEKVVSVINNYLDPMIELIMKYDGTIDEFIGDAILAIFGAPLSKSDDTERAIACAVEMQLAMKGVNKSNREQGLPEVELGVALNTGTVVVGNIGSEKRTKYGIVGRHVNLTSRIESYTVGKQIFISEFTYDDLDIELRVDSQMKVEPKGVKKPIKIYEIGGIGGKYNLCLPEKLAPKLKTLIKKIEIVFKIIKGNDTGAELEKGTILELGGKTAIMKSNSEVNALDNLKIKLLKKNGDEITNELYAKIIKEIEGTKDSYLISFTSIPEVAEKFLKKLAN